MSQVFKISEAASLAMHTMAWLASNREKPASTREIAESLNVSANHLSKVLQRLDKAGMVSSIRGPKGGFELAADPKKTSLLKVYEVIEGPLQISSCMFDKPACNGQDCIFGDVLGSLSSQVKDYLAKNHLNDFLKTFERNGGDEKKNHQDRRIPV